MIQSSIPLTHIPLMVTLCKTIVQYHTEDVYTDMVKIQNISIIIRTLHFALLQPHLPVFHSHCLPNPGNHTLVSISIMLSFAECCINGVIGYITFSHYLLSLRTYPWRFIQVVPF